MLSVQVDVRPLRLPASDVEVPPPIGKCCQRMAGVFVQSVVELVLGESNDHTSDEDDGPVGLYEREKLVRQHVEVRLALGGVEKEFTKRSCAVFEGRKGGRLWRVDILVSIPYRPTARPVLQPSCLRGHGR